MVCISLVGCLKHLANETKQLFLAFEHVEIWVNQLTRSHAFMRSFLHWNPMVHVPMIGHLILLPGHH